MEYAKHEIDDDFAEKFAKQNEIKPVTTINGFKYICNGAKCEIDNNLKSRIDHDIKAVCNKWDFVWAVSGLEGSGKSKGLGITIVSYCVWKLKKPFRVNNIVFTTEQFYKLVDTATPFSIIFWDEFIMGGSSEDTMTNIQKALKKKFTVIRSKRLIIILIIPHFHMMSKYWAISRTRALVDCVSYDGIIRGDANFYGYSKKRYAYIHGKKVQTLENFKKDFTVKFLDLGDKSITGVDIIDWDAYEKKKQESTKEIEKQREKRSLRLEKYLNSLRAIAYNLKKQGNTFKEIRDICGNYISLTSLKEWVRDYNADKSQKSIEG